MRRKITGAISAIAVMVGGLAVATGGTATADTVVNGCTIVSEPSAGKYSNCPGIDFAGANLANVDLSYANLTGASFVGVSSTKYLRLSNANLTKANFSGLDLRQASFVIANATDANFSGVNLSGVNLLYVDFVRTDLSGANLSKSTLVADKVTDSNLKGANLSEADMRSTTLWGSDLSGADLRSANMTNARFSRTVIDNADFTDALLTGLDFTGTAAMPSLGAITGDVENAGDAGAVVSWDSTPAAVTGVTLGDCNPQPGSRFGVGSTTVNCKVQSVNPTGLQSTSGTGRFQVNVKRPVIVVPPIDPPNPGTDPGDTDGGTGSLPFGS